MLNVSTALSTLSPRAAPTPGKVAGGDFRDTLDGLITAPVADTLLVMPGAKVEVPAPLGKAAAPVAEQPVATGAAPATVLACMIEPRTGPMVTETDLTASLLPAVPTQRQSIADDGKTLPDDVPDDDPSKDVIWLPTALILPVPIPVAPPPALALTKAGATIAPAVATPAAVNIAAPPAAATPVEAGAQSGEAIAQPQPPPDRAPAAAGVVVEVDAPIAPANNGAPTVRQLDTAKLDLPVRTDAPTATAQPALQQQTPLQPVPAVLPAGQAFAAAIAAAVQQGRDERESSETHTPLAIAIAALDRLHTPAVAAPADARQAALDLRQDSGLQGMIDHIEVLRDGANAGDTRIRLVPDALGAVDVSVRNDGERVHVHFNTENQASARLIAEAQPRLAELAEARGLKLGQTSVDSGDGQQRQQQPAQPIQFTRPVAVGDGIETTDDLRVA